MTFDSGTLAGVALAAPFLAALLILVTPARLAEAWGYLAAAVALAATALLLPPVRAGDPVTLTLLPLTEGLDLWLHVDALGVVFALLASGLWVVTSLYTSGYMRATNLSHRPRFLAAFAASIGAALGVALAGNLLTFLLFYELLTLATYPLVVHKETGKAFAAGRRYLAFSLGGGLALLTAVAWTWQLAGTLDFTPGGFLQRHASGATMAALFVLYVAGVAVKSAVMPLHAWLPAAMVAPTPVSALLHAVAVVKAGVFGMLRVVGFVFGPASLTTFPGAEVLAGLAMVTIVAGSLLALRQDNLKRRLAYSTVVQLSYMVLGAALIAPLAMAGSVMHMVNHGLAKITLFFCAGAIYAAAHRENVSELRGLGRQMPWTFGAFTVASLALVGLPGLNGFVGKFFLARGALAAGDLLALGVMLGTSLLTALYLLPIVRIAYFPNATGRSEPGSGRPGTGSLPDHLHAPHTDCAEAPAALLVPIVATAALVVIFGVVPMVMNVQFELAADVAARTFGVVP
jgi:multicomponent Na+:H+ antiporter subunit D